MSHVDCIERVLLVYIKFVVSRFFNSTYHLKRYHYQLTFMRIEILLICKSQDKNFVDFGILFHIPRLQFLELIYHFTGFLGNPTYIHLYPN